MTTHHKEERDPIMEDNEFSLRFGNPIQVIHDAEKHPVDSFEPTANHVPGSLASSIGDIISARKKAPLKQQGSFRDWSSCSDFYHNQNGTVSETEHKNENT
ncbi:hypothetical protein A0J61_08416 [Choanephora cucurbitarum]|uniref:Uncharacterized protein n=1 Tax=Choanephora cucurbitarum TaxID=101091 RepID=A0A1C7N865_9FUNG|nr:hypothetical protein A0J61_08416 [Choanephora cucurbitarum]